MTALDRATAAQRREALRIERASQRALTDAYRAVLARLQGDLDELTTRIAATQAAGETVGASWLDRDSRYRALIAQTEAEIGRYSRNAEAVIANGQRQAATAALGTSEAVMAAALGTPPPGVVATFNRLPVGAIEELVGNLGDGRPLSDLLEGLGAEASKAGRTALIEALGKGLGPRQLAREFRLGTNESAVRALRISRQEINRAYRDASLANYRANSDVCSGWTWVCAGSARTCAICFAKHGTFHKLDEAFASHICCRCCCVARTKSWEELGFAGIPDTRPEIESGSTLFGRLSEQDQRTVLGPGKYTAFHQGKFLLSELVEETYSPIWGPGLRERPLGYFINLAERRAGTFRKFATQELADEWGQSSYRAWVAKLKPDEREALDLFKGAHSKDVNHYLRGITEDHDAKLGKKLTGQIDKALRKSSVPENVTVYRGMRPEAFEGVIDPTDPGKLRGLVLPDKGFAATSLSEETARGGYGIHGILAEIRVPKGTKAAYLDTSGIHQYAYTEYEMLLPRGTRFKVVGARKEGNTTRLILEVLDAE